MSAGYWRSRRADCPSCAHPIHPGLLGDMRAHVAASGQPVRFACIRCGAGIRIAPLKPKAKAKS